MLKSNPYSIDSGVTYVDCRAKLTSSASKPIAISATVLPALVYIYDGTSLARLKTLVCPLTSVIAAFKLDRRTLNAFPGFNSEQSTQAGCLEEAPGRSRWQFRILNDCLSFRPFIFLLETPETPVLPPKMLHQSVVTRAGIISECGYCYKTVVGRSNALLVRLVIMLPLYDPANCIHTRRSSTAQMQS